jgi:hypothetical protein
MSERTPVYRIEIKACGTPPKQTYRWEIYKNVDVLPTLRSEQLFVSRAAGLADANRSRMQLAVSDLQNRK